MSSESINETIVIKEESPLAASQNSHIDEKEKTAVEIPRLVTLYLYLTSSCNLCCHHCWLAPSYTGTNKALAEHSVNREQLRKAIKEAKDIGLASVKFTGGEPIYHPDFLDIAADLTEEGLDLTMETNGTLITREMSRFIKDKTSISQISISLDSHLAEHHDHLRGKPGSFEKAVQGIKYLTEVGIYPQIIMSIYNGNINDVENVIELATKLEASSLKFNIINSGGRANTMRKNNNLLSFQQIMDFNNKLNKDLRPNSSIELSVFLPHAFYSVKELLTNPCRCQILNILGILGNGDFALCGIGQTISDLCFGNLATDSIIDVWNSNFTLTQLRNKLSQSLPGICNRCVHSKSCLCCCIAENYLESGQLVSPNWLCSEAEKLNQFPQTRLI